MHMAVDRVPGVPQHWYRQPGRGRRGGAGIVHRVAGRKASAGRTAVWITASTAAAAAVSLQCGGGGRVCGSHGGGLRCRGPCRRYLGVSAESAHSRPHQVTGGARGPGRQGVDAKHALPRRKACPPPQPHPPPLVPAAPGPTRSVHRLCALLVALSWRCAALMRARCRAVAAGGAFPEAKWITAAGGGALGESGVAAALSGVGQGWVWCQVAARR